jgi:hypothetical protein
MFQTLPYHRQVQLAITVSTAFIFLLLSMLIADAHKLTQDQPAELQAYRAGYEVGFIDALRHSGADQTMIDAAKEMLEKNR